MAILENLYNTFSGWSFDVASGRRSKTETYTVVLDETPVDFEEVLDLSGFAEGDMVGVYTITKVGVSPREDESTIFDIDLTLEIVEHSLHKKDRDTKIPVFSFGKWFLPRRVDYDTETGVAIRNSANEAFGDAIERPIPQLSIKMTIRTSREDFSRLDDIGKINSKAFDLGGVSFPKYCGMLYDFDIENFYDEDGNLYHLAHYEFRRNMTEDINGAVIGFKEEIRDWGFMQIVNGKQERITINGSFPSAPVLLQANGAMKPNPATAIPDYLTFALDPLADFSSYKLPTAYPLRRSIRQ